MSVIFSKTQMLENIDYGSHTLVSSTASSIHPEKAALDRTIHAFQMRYYRRVHVCKTIHNDPLILGF